jgi:uncharacterized protein (DUF433 family)
MAVDTYVGRLRLNGKLISVEDVLEEYPKLTRADVQACLKYKLKP